MNLRSLLLFAFSLLLLASACKPRKVSTDPVPPVPPVAVVNPCGAALLKGKAPESAMVSGLTNSLAGDCLELKVSYGGGCEKHDFAMYWDGNWAESMPPQVNLFLYHNNHGDNCRALLNEKLVFDLQPVRYNGVGQVIVNIHAEGQKLQRANYTY